MILHSVYFSPSGTTKRVAELVTGNIAGRSVNYDITQLVDISPAIGADDVVMFVMPVYAGRVPALAAERLASVKGNGQKAIAVVVYGNRDYDDALAELCDIIVKNGFEVAAAGAFIAQHCIFPKVAANRPDKDDEIKIAEFSRLAKQAIDAGGSLDVCSVKGNRPYKKPGSIPLHPSVDKNKCDKCGICSEQCPSQAISPENPQATDDSKCISCCRCINVCPRGARRFGGVLYKIAGYKFVKDNSARREPEWFF